jgi:hypothetical protein
VERVLLIVKPALGSAELPTGEELGELAQIIEIFICDPTDIAGLGGQPT